ncbi:MAG: ECF transporter S component [Candidatus Bathyarchaeia archaeon]
MKINAKEVALISVFAALQLIISRLPGIPIYGVAEGRIEPQLILMPVMGLILGPWVGGLAAFIGNFIAWLIPTTTFFGMLMLPTVPIGTIVCGSLSRSGNKSDWKLAAAILALLNLLWYLSPPGLLVPYYPILHLLALALILLLRSKIYNYIKSDIKRKFAIGVTIAGFSGIMANHMTGNLIYIVSVNWFVQLKGIKDALTSLGFSWLKSGLPKNDPTGLGTIFTIFFPVSVVERIILTILSSLICIGVVYTLKRSGFMEF